MGGPAKSGAMKFPTNPKAKARIVGMEKLAKMLEPKTKFKKSK